jgi:hypothetical protein
LEAYQSGREDLIQASVVTANYKPPHKNHTHYYGQLVKAWIALGARPAPPVVDNPEYYSARTNYEKIRSLAPYQHFNETYERGRRYEEAPQPDVCVAEDILQSGNDNYEELVPYRQELGYRGSQVDGGLLAERAEMLLFKGYGPGRVVLEARGALTLELRAYRSQYNRAWRQHREDKPADSRDDAVILRAYGTTLAVSLGYGGAAERYQFGVDFAQAYAEETAYEGGVQTAYAAAVATNAYRAGTGGSTGVTLYTDPNASAQIYEKYQQPGKPYVPDWGAPGYGGDPAPGCEGLYVRKWAADFTPVEWSTLKSAFDGIAGSGVLWELNRIHQQSYNHHGTGTSASALRFGCWHRDFMRRFEHELHRIEPDVKVAIWNFEVERDPGHPIMLHLSHTAPVQGPTTINVNYSAGSGSLFPSTGLNAVLGEPEFEEMLRLLQVTVHNSAHMFWGGDMGSTWNAAACFAFYALHAFVDLVITHWLVGNVIPTEPSLDWSEKDVFAVSTGLCAEQLWHGPKGHSAPTAPSGTTDYAAYGYHVDDASTPFDWYLLGTDATLQPFGTLARGSNSTYVTYAGSAFGPPAAVFAPTTYPGHIYDLS